MLILYRIKNNFSNLLIRTTSNKSYNLYEKYKRDANYKFFNKKRER